MFDSLEKYITLFIEGTRIINEPPSKITAKYQSEISPDLLNDKSSLSPEETIDDLRDKFGKNFMITFVKKYDKDTPRLSINPRSFYATPHGIYSYIFNKENFTKLMFKKSIDRSNFAINRPYFHIFRVIGDSVEVNSDGSTNAYNKVNSQENFNDYFEDLKEAIRISLMSLPVDKRRKEPLRDFIHKYNYIHILRKNAKRRTSSIARLIFFSYDAVCLKAPENKKENLDDFIHKIALFLNDLSNVYYRHKFYKAIRNKVPGYLFLKLYNSIMLLSYITNNPKKGPGKHNDPVRFSMILNSIGIKGITDKGYALLHDKQPSQAMAINFGGENEDDNKTFSNIENLGTYRNLFYNLSKEELEELFIKNADYLH